MEFSGQDLTLYLATANIVLGLVIQTFGVPSQGLCDSGSEGVWQAPLFVGQVLGSTAQFLQLHMPCPGQCQGRGIFPQTVCLSCVQVPGCTLLAALVLGLPLLCPLSVLVFLQPSPSLSETPVSNSGAKMTVSGVAEVTVGPVVTGGLFVGEVCWWCQSCGLFTDRNVLFDSRIALVATP